MWAGGCHAQNLDSSAAPPQELRCMRRNAAQSVAEGGRVTLWGGRWGGHALLAGLGGLRGGAGGEEDVCGVTFQLHVKGGDMARGEVPLVVGSHSALGRWDVTSGVPLLLYIYIYMSSY
jgi:hypothetical protein